jgi:hypothetical protein
MMNPTTKRTTNETTTETRRSSENRTNRPLQQRIGGMGHVAEPFLVAQRLRARS